MPFQRFNYIKSEGYATLDLRLGLVLFINGLSRAMALMCICLMLLPLGKQIVRNILQTRHTLLTVIRTVRGEGSPHDTPRERVRSTPLIRLDFSFLFWAPTKKCAKQRQHRRSYGCAGCPIVE